MKRLALLALLLGIPGVVLADSAPWELTEVLAVGPVARHGRSPVNVDLVAAKLVAGTWRAPTAGATLGGRPWTALQADAKGWFRDRNLVGGYAHATLTLPRAQTLILEASGHSMVYVNGEPRMGDPYQTGYVRLPVALKAGQNTFLFSCGRGALRARLAEPRAAVELNVLDATVPDLVLGETGEHMASVVLINTTRQMYDHLHLEAQIGDDEDSLVFTSLRTPLAPLSVRKVAFALNGPREAAGTVRAKLRLSIVKQCVGVVLDEAEVAVRVREPFESRKRTFTSPVDGSVQYYAVRPARPVRETAPPPSMVLSLHGASVEASVQVDAYASKSWAHIVAPTNRRPFGFDWEDWGRLDALTVLAHAQERLRHDPARVYLTGHSMGGHGVWHVGATFPDRFAALAPSAGWSSFFSYGGKRRGGEGGVDGLFARASSASDTVALLGNYAQQGIYVLHGDADDNVPVDQARRMRELLLQQGHTDLGYHEQKGAKHWWDDSPEPGSSCVDWPGIFETFSRRVLPPVESVRRFSFTTASPGVSARCHWLTVHGQERALIPSTVNAECDPHTRQFRLQTTNASRLAVRPAPLRPGAPLTIVIDGQTLEAPWPSGGDPQVWLAKRAGAWAVSQRPSPALKSPERFGPFKHAYRNGVTLVYATQGTAEENAWAFAKARYDAEQFWVRGNGDLQLVRDVAFQPNADARKNVVLYGHAQSNAAWESLLGEGPVRVERGLVRVGDRVLRGDGLGCVFVRPRPGSDSALVGVVAGSGAVGERLTERLPVFVSGAGFPDLLVVGPDVLTQGAKGVELTGFFGDDWGVGSGEWAIRN